MGIQLESRSESTAKLMPEVDALTLLGRKPWQASIVSIGERRAWYVPVIVSASF